MANYDFIVDVESGRSVSSFLSTLASGRESFVFGDKPTITCRLVEANSNDANLPWRQLDLTGQTIRVGIGDPGGDPTGGTFSITFGGDTTTDLAYNSTAAEVESALDLLASVITAGGVTVTAYGAGGYRVTFATSQSLITADTANLTPSTSAYIAEAVSGGASQIINIELDPAAYIELTSDMASPSIAVTTIRTGVTATTSEQQRIIISGDPHAGTYSLTIATEESSSIPYDASTDEIASALESLPSIGAGNVTVTGDSLDYTLDFDKSLGDVGDTSGDVTNLSGAVGKTGTLDLNVVGILEALDGASSKTSVLEIVRFTTTGSISDTVYQNQCTINQDVIPDTPASSTPLPEYVTSGFLGTPKDITSTTYTVASGDDDYNLRFDNVASIAVTLPTHTNDPITVGVIIMCEQVGAGQFAISGDTGVTVTDAWGTTSFIRGSMVFAIKTGDDTWTVFGDVT